MKKNHLDKIKILLADNDTHIASVTRQNLRAMGFKNIKHVRTAELAIEHLNEGPVDILKTEWTLPKMDGIHLTEFIRRKTNFRTRTVPIIMLTGKGEKPDVLIARDVGITEYVIKPFTSKTLYARIEQLVDNPRPLVFSKSYVGPDRRRKYPPEQLENDRRKTPPTVAKSETDIDITAEAGPYMVLPDHALKKTIGIKGPLSTIITPAVLAKAQQTIDSMSGEGIKWIKDDLDAMQEAVLKSTNEPILAHDILKERALSIKSRAGTFGYQIISEITRHLYLFLTSSFTPREREHVSLVRKHIDSIKVILASNLKKPEGVGKEIVEELHRLIEKYENNTQESESPSQTA